MRIAILTLSMELSPRNCVWQDIVFGWGKGPQLKRQFLLSFPQNSCTETVYSSNTLRLYLNFPDNPTGRLIYLKL